MPPLDAAGLSFDDLIPKQGLSFDDLIPAKAALAFDDLIPKQPQGTFEPTTGVYIPPNAKDVPLAGPVGRVLDAAREGYGGEAFPSVLTAEYQARAEASNDPVTRQLLAPAARVAGTAAALGSAAFRGLQQGITETGAAAGLPLLGRDIAGMLESEAGRLEGATPAGVAPPGLRATEGDLRGAAAAFPQEWRSRPFEGAPATETAPAAETRPSEAPTAGSGQLPLTFDDLIPETPEGPRAVSGPPARLALTFDDLIPKGEEAPAPETPPIALPDGTIAPQTAEPTTKPRRTLGPRPVTPFVPVPKEPERLINFLRRKTVLSPGTTHEQTIPGGIKDVGGDLAAMIGGPRARPGLINNDTGRSWNSVREHAHGNGYFPNYPPAGEAPDDEHLIHELILRDHEGHPVYSSNDQEHVEAYQNAIAQNHEIDRLATEHGLPTLGITHAQFFDRLHDQLSQDEHAEEHAAQAAAMDSEWDDFMRQTGEDMPDWKPGERYGMPRTFEDLENEYRQEADAGTPGGRATGDARSGSVGQGSDAGAAGVSPGDGGAGDGRRGGEGEGSSGFAAPIDAYHGTPHEFDAFDTAKIGTGEGAQAYGHGLYFSQAPGVAKSYQHVLSQRMAATPEHVAAQLALNKAIDASNKVAGDFIDRGVSLESPEAERALAPHRAAIEAAHAKVDAFEVNPGHLLTVRINAEPDEMLDWDRALSQQPPGVREALLAAHPNVAGETRRQAAWVPQKWTDIPAGTKYADAISAGTAYNALASELGSYKAASDALSRAGIKGIRYLDQGSRRAADFTITPPNQTVAGDWMVKDSQRPDSQGMHFQTEVEARAALAKMQAELTHNVVVFDHNDIEITHRNGEPVAPKNMTEGEAGTMLAEQRGPYGANRSVVFRRSYPSRTGDEMRLFDRQQRIIEAPDESRKMWRGKPWVIETPTAGGKMRVMEFDHFATRQEAETSAARRAPDINEKAAHAAVQSGDLVGGIQTELARRGFDVRRDDATTTNSKYLYVGIGGGHTVKIRFSDHSKTVFLGSNARNHLGDIFDFSTGKSRPEMVSSMASLLRTLEDARGWQRTAQPIEDARVTQAPPPTGETTPGDGGSQLAERKPPLPTGPDLFGATRKPTETRAPEPTVRTDPSQTTLPGMGPSAVQAQAARDAAPPRSGQEAPGGLFAPKPVEQPAFPIPRISKWPTDEGFRDLLPSFPAKTPRGSHEHAADWVLELGKATGHEHIAVVDNRTGEVIHAGTSGRANFLPFQHENTMLETDAYTMHHNHPGNRSLSPEDIYMLANPGISHIVAHGHGGDTYYASLGPKLIDKRKNTPAGIRAVTNELNYLRSFAVRIADKLVRPLFDNGTMAPDVANRAYFDVVNRLLNAEGAINYASTVQLPAEVAGPLKKLVRQYYGPVADDRSTRTIQPKERTAGLHQGVERGAAQGQPVSEKGGGRREGISGDGRLLEEGLTAASPQNMVGG